jgi:hypothetical protein
VIPGENVAILVSGITRLRDPCSTVVTRAALSLDRQTSP